VLAVLYTTYNNGRQPGSVSVFSLGSDDALSEVSGSPFAVGEEVDAMAFSPDGRFLATLGLTTLSVFSVGATGALTEVGATQVPSVAGNGLAFSPDGRLLAATDGTNGTVSVFSFASSGALTQVPGSPFGSNAGYLAGAAFSPNGEFLATANVAVGPPAPMFSVGPGGRLTEVAQPPLPPFRAGGGPDSVVFSPDGRLLAASQGDRIADYSVASDGTLALAPGSPFDGISSFGFGAPTFSPDGGVLVATGSPDVAAGAPRGLYAFAVAPTGALTNLCGSPFPLDTTDPVFTAFSPDGRLLATVDPGIPHPLSVYTVQMPTAKCPGTGGNYFTASRVSIRAKGTISLFVKVPGAGRVDVLATAWRDNLARTAIVQPAPRRFVYARASRHVDAATTVHLLTRANKRGTRLLHHHTYRVTLRVWVTYTPTAGTPRSIGFYNLHPPAGMRGL
jgi:WD40 repeat protein